MSRTYHKDRKEKLGFDKEYWGIHHARYWGICSNDKHGICPGSITKRITSKKDRAIERQQIHKMLKEYTND